MGRKITLNPQCLPLDRSIHAASANVCDHFLIKFRYVVTVFCYGNSEINVIKSVTLHRQGHDKEPY